MSSQRSFWRSSQGSAAVVLIVVAVYFLLMEHRTHLFQALPFLIILLCPLMHIFMHRGHGHSGHAHGEEGSDSHSKLTESEAYKKGLEDGRNQSRQNNLTDDRR